MMLAAGNSIQVLDVGGRNPLESPPLPSRVALTGSCCQELELGVDPSTLIWDAGSVITWPNACPDPLPFLVFNKKP